MYCDCFLYDRAAKENQHEITECDEHRVLVVLLSLCNLLQTVLPQNFDSKLFVSLSN